MFDYIVWHITESEQELLDSLTHHEYFAQKVANLKTGSRRKLEVLAVRRALKELFYGKEQVVVYDEHGRPSLAASIETEPQIPASKKEAEPQDPEPLPYISISHTADYAAVITSDNPVGIDIERRGNRVGRVVRHFLKPEEVARLTLLAGKDEALMQLLLHLSWSAKEAAYKVLGHEYYDLQRLTSVTMVSMPLRQITLEVQGQEQPMVLHFDYTDDYVLTFYSNSSIGKSEI